MELKVSSTSQVSWGIDNDPEETLSNKKEDSNRSELPPFFEISLHLMAAVCWHLSYKSMLSRQPGLLASAKVTFGGSGWMLFVSFASDVV